MDRVTRCPVCHDLTPFPGYPYLLSPYRWILSSAGRGCVLCKVILDSMIASGAETLPEAIQAIGITSQLGHPMKILVATRRDKSSKGNTSIGLSGIKGNDGQLPQLGVFREIDAELKNPYGQVLAKNWIQICVSNHSSCNSNVSTEMPTRLLDLMPAENSIDLRLVLSKDFSAKYIALSHCWGDCKIARTTAQNIHSMFHNILLSSLPQTFQDAVSLCREFQIRYLWIDSLCIIQDDAIEWGHEAGHMTSVYGNTFLVIAASASSDDNIGMFPRRERHYCHQLDFNWNGHAIGVKVQPWRPHYEHSFDGEGPLSTRSWAYQERLLGQRVLSYHQAELFWECNETWRCECGLGDNIGNSKHPYNLWEIFDSGNDNLDTLYRQWHQTIVERFSCRDLSKASDKLPAISGVAEAFRSRLNDEYLAGLWRNDIIRGLLWRNSSKVSNCHLPEVYRAPSWSWASIDGAIKYFDIDVSSCTLYIDIIAISCTLAREEPTGEVVDGWITASGLLKIAWVDIRVISETETPHPGVFANRNQLDCIGWLEADCELAAGVGRTDEGAEEGTAIRSNWQSSTSLDEQEISLIRPISNLCARVWCLKLVQATTYVNDEDKVDGESTFILVLGRSQRQHGKFERLGILKLLAGDTRAKYFDDTINTTVTIV